MRVRRTLFLISAFSLAAVAASAAPGREPQAQVQDAERKRKTIEADGKKYSREQHEVDRGTVTCLYDGRSLRKIEVEKYGADVAVLESYFYWDGKLFLAQWLIPQGGISDTKPRNLEYGFYFSNDVPIRCTKDGNAVDIAASDHDPREVLQYGNDLRDRYAKR